MKKVFIKDFNQGLELEDEYFVVKSFKQAKTKNGKNYWDLKLSDKTGEIPAKVWQDNISISEQPDEGDIISVSAFVEEYGGNNQLKIANIKIAQDYDKYDFLPVADVDIEALYEDMIKAVKKVKDENLKKILDRLLETEIFVEKFKEAPGAEFVHHAYLGGLMVHLDEMLSFVEPLIKKFPKLNFDLLITGVLLHDIGKMKELEVNKTIVHTVEGKLFGHIVQGLLMAENLIKEIKDFPAELRVELLHMIISHHGKQEWGSPVAPMTPEAIVLHYLDMLSTRASIAFSELEKLDGTDQRFTKRIRFLENVELYSSPLKNNE